MTVIFNPAFIIQKPFSIQFSMTSQGDKLIVVNDYGKVTVLVNAMTILSFVVLFLFVAASLSHKMIGVEILHAFQTICLLQALSNNSTPVFGLLRYFSIVLGNFLFLSNAQINVYSSKYADQYNPMNQDFAEGIVICTIILLFLCCLFPLLWKWKQIFDDPRINPKTFGKVDSFVKVMYTYLFFPITMGFLMVNLLVANTVIDAQLMPMFSALPLELSSFLSLMMVLISSFVFFFECKFLVI